MKTLGLLGGMSAESTTLYYQTLNRLVNDAMEQPDLPDRYKIVECLRWRQVMAEWELAELRARRESVRV